ncbi:MAG TPA: Hsp70 family protein [Patescibacteria group bacterium]|nr:Hsp70 family protein [Patescibacteria group bacterium]
MNLKPNTNLKEKDDMDCVAYGLDFGTTNSAISVLGADGSVKVLPVNQSGGEIVKSVLFFPPRSQKAYVGQEAIQEYVKAGMRGRLIQSIKSALADDKFTGTLINGERHQIEDLIAVIISFLKSRADEIIGRQINRVVLGRPAIFSSDPDKEKLARERLIVVAQKAGFQDIEFQLEPIAAALHYESSLKQPQTVLVADLGGGTSDFTLMKLSPEKASETQRDADILATNGIYIGGDNLDARIMWRKVVKYFGSEANYQSGSKWLHVPHRLIDSICDWHFLSFIKEDRFEQELIQMIRQSADNPEAIDRLQSLIDNNLGFALSRSVEIAKCELSSIRKSSIIFNEDEINISEEITREEFENSIKDELAKIKDCLHRLLASAGLTPKDVDTVFLTGGTSYVPAIKKLFQDEIGADKIVSGDNFVSVAAGLALSSKLFFRK